MNLETQKNLAANLRRLRLSHGYTQAELARKLQINRSLLARCESGIRSPSLDTLYELAQFYGIPIDLLLETEPAYIVEAAQRSEAVSRDEYRLLTQFRRLSAFSQGRLLEKAEDLAVWDAAVKKRSIPPR